MEVEGMAVVEDMAVVGAILEEAILEEEVTFSVGDMAVEEDHMDLDLDHQVNWHFTYF
jgi:hypothetical protein